MDINTHTIQGRLAADPQIHHHELGSLARMRVMTNYRYKDRNNEWQSRETGHTVIVRGELIDLVDCFRKGDAIFIIGFAEDREYLDSQKVHRIERQLVAKTIAKPLVAPRRQEQVPPNDERHSQQTPASKQSSVPARQERSAPARQEPTPPPRQTSSTASSQRPSQQHEPAPAPVPPSASHFEPREEDAFGDMDDLVRRSM